MDDMRKVILVLIFLLTTSSPISNKLIVSSKVCASPWRNDDRPKGAFCDHKELFLIRRGLFALVATQGSCLTCRPHWSSTARRSIFDCTTARMEASSCAQATRRSGAGTGTTWAGTAWTNTGATRRLTRTLVGSTRATGAATRPGARPPRARQTVAGARKEKARTPRQA